MDNPTPPFFRWLFALGCFGVAGWLVNLGIAGDNVDVGPFLAAALVFALGVVSIFADLLALATRPFTAFIDSVFFPGGKAAKPTLNLKLPEYYRREGRHEEALAEYRKILKHYPGEPRAYEGAIELLVEEFGDSEAARKLYRRSQRKKVEIAPQVIALIPWGTR